MSKQRSLFVLGSSLVLVALVWRVSIAPIWTNRIPRGWFFHTTFAGTQTNADSITGKIPEKDVLGEYERAMRVVDERGRPDSVRIENRMTTFDIATHATTWQYIVIESGRSAHGRPHGAPVSR